MVLQQEASCLSSRTGNEVTAHEKPNILFILLDQMRWDCLSILGHPVGKTPNVETPNVDAVARSGVVFSAAYSSCPSCIAARASIMTGLTPSSHGRLGYRDCVPWRYANMLPEVLTAAGYQTHCVGKTHFFPQGARLGFESIDSYEASQNFDGRYVNDYYEWLRERTGGRVREGDHGLQENSWATRPSHLPEELHNNSWVATRCIDFLRRRDKGRPFFLNMSFHRPHAPLDPPQPYYDMYKDRPIPRVPVGEWARIHDVPVTDLNAWHGRLDRPLLEQARRGYYAQVAHIDSQIGRVLRELEHAGAGPTAVIFTSDHGEMLGDNNLFRKTYAYESSAAVPLVVSAPGGARGKVCDSPCVLEDIYPTILDLAGVPVPSLVEGQSLAPAVAGTGPAPAREYIHGEHSACYSKEEAMQFLTDGREKYIWFTLTGREQLFDLASDPCETRDLAQAPGSRDRLERWRKRMVDHLAPRTRDGLSDGKKLIAGVELPAVRPELLV